MSTNDTPNVVTSYALAPARTIDAGGVTYEFLFMHASGDQLRQISNLVDKGVLRPVVGRVFDFDRTVEAVQSIGTGGLRGKAVITRA